MVVTTSSGNTYFDMAWQGTVCVCVCVCVYMIIVPMSVIRVNFFFVFSECFFYTHPPFMYFDSVGLSSHPQNTNVTGAGGDGEEQKC